METKETNIDIDFAPKITTALVIGAGYRDQTYSQYARTRPDEFQVVGVAEPKERIRQKMKTTYSIPEDRCFVDWQEAATQEKFADCALVCTQDQNHIGPAIAFAKKGYHILLEKPMAVTLKDCLEIYKTCRENDVILAVCHVLRYHPAVKKLKELIDSGLIGEVVHITHTEPVGYWHFAHSFVRGNWRKESESTFSLLAKCCHDVDLLCYWLSDKKCTKVSSFGSLVHFKKENKPQNAGNRCLDCEVEPSCAYSAKKIYLDSITEVPKFPSNILCDLEDLVGEKYKEYVKDALKTSPYGRCVYECDNDVCDHQVVNFQYDDGTTATLNMVAFTKEICSRRTEIFGTKGQLRWNSETNYFVSHFDFLKNESRDYECIEKNPGWGHGGSDFFTIESFSRAVAKNDSSLISTGPYESLSSHILTFAAEESRKEGRIVDMRENKWLQINI